MRRVYAIKIIVNKVVISRVVIDPHFESKHLSSMNDGLILELVAELNEGMFLSEDVDENGYQYFTYDSWIKGKFYRLVWLLSPAKDFIGVINAYRRHHGRGN